MALMATAFAGMVGPLVDAGAVTVMARSVTQEAPWFPQDLTWSTCAPAVAVIWAAIDVPMAVVVLALLSRE